MIVVRWLQIALFLFYFNFFRGQPVSRREWGTRFQRTMIATNVEGVTWGQFVYNRKGGEGQTNSSSTTGSR